MEVGGTPVDTTEAVAITATSEPPTEPLRSRSVRCLAPTMGARTTSKIIVAGSRLVNASTGDPRPLMSHAVTRSGVALRSTPSAKTFAHPAFVQLTGAAH